MNPAICLSGKNNIIDNKEKERWRDEGRGFNRIYSGYGVNGFVMGEGGGGGTEDK
jgi:hypothetical protein